jgi:hypothetical protein
VATTARRATEQDLLAMPEDGQKYDDVLPGFNCLSREIL